MAEITIPWFWLLDTALLCLSIGMWTSRGIHKEMIFLPLAAIFILPFNSNSVQNTKLTEAYKNKAEAFENLSNTQGKLLNVYRAQLGVTQDTIK